MRGPLRVFDPLPELSTSHLIPNFAFQPLVYLLHSSLENRLELLVVDVDWPLVEAAIHWDENVVLSIFGDTGFAEIFFIGRWCGEADVLIGKRVLRKGFLLGNDFSSH